MEAAPCNQRNRTLLCVSCRMNFGRRKELHDHIKNFHQRRKEVFICEFCYRTYRTFKSYDQHKNRRHRCHSCKFETGDKKELAVHMTLHSKKCSSAQLGGADNKSDITPFKRIEAFRGFLRTYRHRYEDKEKKEITIEDYFRSYDRTLKNIFNESLINLRHIKVQISIYAKFTRDDNVDLENEETCNQYINSHLRVCLNMFYYDKIIQESVKDISHIVEIFSENGSGWVFTEVLGCDIRVTGFKPFQAGNIHKLPLSIVNKKATVTVDNKDDMCFKWAFLSIMHYDTISSHHRERPSSYSTFEPEYNFSSVGPLCTLKDITKFESDNKDKNFAINVFSVNVDKNNPDNNKVDIEVDYISTKVFDSDRKIVNVLYYKPNDKDIGHYYGITNINKLLGKRNYHKHYICYNCLHFFTSQDSLFIHQNLCREFRSQQTLLPHERDGVAPTLKFSKYENKLKVGHVIYADFEALLIDSNEQVSEKMRTFQKHVPCGYAFVVVDNDGKVFKKEVYRGEDCIDRFVKEILEVSKLLLSLYQHPVPMLELSNNEIRLYNQAKICHICETPVNHKDKVRDHCHLSGKYRGCAHSVCNLNFKQRNKIPVVMHNFRGYDSHLLLGGLRQCSGDIKVIPTNSERFMSIICDRFVFLDSMMFLNVSLETLVQNLKSETNNIDEGDRKFHHNFSVSTQVLGLEKSKKLSRKGVYPYEYFTSWEKFKNKNFPLRNEFFSSLTSSVVSKNDYSYAKSVYQDYCTNMGEYHDLYLLTDTLLLADVFENFRNVAIHHNKLDPLHYFSLAGYAWDIALYRSKVEIDLITDINAYNFLESGIRGGIAMITLREANANNKYMHNYKKEEESSFIAFWDKNNLYGEALQASLPTRNFKWMSEKDVKSLNSADIMLMKASDDKGMILEVDLEYGDELHLTHSDYPLCPERMCVKKKQLSPYQSFLLDRLNMKYNENQQKLVPHLGARTKYITHYRNLQFYLSQGLKLKKIHRVLEFEQEPWLKDHVNFCTSMRQMSKSAFEKDYWKFLVNSVFGKSMERVRDRMDVRIVQNVELATKLVSSNRIKTFRILEHCKDIVVITLNKNRVMLDRPIYTAFTVLELSKLFMYDFHYNKVRQWYGDNAHLLMTDTDSLSYLIYTKDLFKDLKRHSDLFDFSDYPANHILYSSKNKKVIGKMKDEAGGDILENFIGLAPKMYSFLSKRMTKKAAKGVKKMIIKKKVRHWVYREILHNQSKLMCRMNLIRSQLHEIKTVNVTKVALHCFDSKRYIKKDGKHTLAHNHFLTRTFL